jgi:hypothetical protein
VRIRPVQIGCFQHCFIGQDDLRGGGLAGSHL